MGNPVVFTVDEVREINRILMARRAGAKTLPMPGERSADNTQAPYTMQIPPELLKFSVQEINDAMAIARKRLGE